MVLQRHVNGNGVNSLQLFVVLTGKDVETMIYNAGRRQVNQGGCVLVPFRQSV